MDEKFSGGVYGLSVTSDKDVIVVSYPANIPAEDEQRLRETWSKAFPNNTTIILGCAAFVNIIRA